MITVYKFGVWSKDDTYYKQRLAVISVVGHDEQDAVMRVRNIIGSDFAIKNMEQ